MTKNQNLKKNGGGGGGEREAVFNPKLYACQTVK